jgi:hypothetical protein
MSSSTASTLRLKRIQARWDAMATEHLRAEVLRLDAELAVAQQRVVELERENHYLNEVACSYRDDLDRVIEQSGAQPALTIDGHILAVPSAEH